MLVRVKTQHIVGKLVVNQNNSKSLKAFYIGEKINYQHTVTVFTHTHSGNKDIFFIPKFAT